MIVRCRVAVVLLGIVGLLLINVHLFHRYSENDSGNKIFVGVYYGRNAEQLNTSTGMGHIIYTLSSIKMILNGSGSKGAWCTISIQARQI